jgi:hypothetical protein
MDCGLVPQQLPQPQPTGIVEEAASSREAGPALVNDRSASVKADADLQQWWSDRIEDRRENRSYHLRCYDSELGSGQFHRFTDPLAMCIAALSKSTNISSILDCSSMYSWRSLKTDLRRRFERERRHVA